MYTTEDVSIFGLGGLRGAVVSSLRGAGSCINVVVET